MRNKHTYPNKVPPSGFIRARKAFFPAMRHVITGTATQSTFFQPKLTVSTPGDAYEQEADTIADQVMRDGESPVAQRMSPAPLNGIMRECSKCGENDEEKKDVHRKESSGGDASGKAAPSIVTDVLSSGGGQSMDSGTRQFMESRFGQDFSRVRIHTGSRAAESAGAIQARAYTSGANVVFGSGQYQPGSDQGKRLLAHELAHVAQQQGQTRAKASGNTTLIQREPEAEKPKARKNPLGVSEEDLMVLFKTGQLPERKTRFQRVLGNSGLSWMATLGILAEEYTRMSIGSMATLPLRPEGSRTLSPRLGFAFSMAHNVDEQLRQSYLVMAAVSAGIRIQQSGEGLFVDLNGIHFDANDFKRSEEDNFMSGFGVSTGFGWRNKNYEAGFETQYLYPLTEDPNMMAFLLKFGGRFPK